MDRQAVTQVLAKTHNNDYWLERIKRGGCFILAEAVSNELILSIADDLSDGRAEACRLYWGDAGRTHASISPYLLPITLDNWPQIEDEICSQANWGVAIVLDDKMAYFTPTQQFSLLLTHLRQWTLIETTDGQQVLRLSDWSVLSTLVQASQAQELSALFGHIEQFMFIAPEADVNAEPEEPNEEADNVAANVALVQWQAMQVINKQTVVDEDPSSRSLSQPQQWALDNMAKLEQHKDSREYLHQHHKDSLVWSDDKILRFIEQHTTLAQSHGFNNAQDKVRFLSLAVIFGDRFVNEPWALKVLKKKETSGSDGKMDKLHEAAMAQLG
ncbi:DUF4123 domain-containing protein [Shewanella surugensis]|uniref:DUF4123 domain-containing protein n=1 Tax=Shewanella surugensis TaxID=212020 RepID=A0ABT0L9Q9_9GAMM|nr:DUF4123 domain-containing protein [Shewanella surugensis]MCL1124457.1 DUF4123 domain-containing protein [Shewanella surugensis]